MVEAERQSGVGGPLGDEGRVFFGGAADRDDAEVVGAEAVFASALTGCSLQVEGEGGARQDVAVAAGSTRDDEVDGRRTHRVAGDQ